MEPIKSYVNHRRQETEKIYQEISDKSALPIGEHYDKHNRKIIVHQGESITIEMMDEKHYDHVKCSEHPNSRIWAVHITNKNFRLGSNSWVWHDTWVCQDCQPTGTDVERHYIAESVKRELLL